MTREKIEQIIAEKVYGIVTTESCPGKPMFNDFGDAFSCDTCDFFGAYDETDHLPCVDYRYASDVGCLLAIIEQIAGVETYLRHVTGYPHHCKLIRKNRVYTGINKDPTLAVGTALARMLLDG